MGNKLFVGGLSWNTTDESLFEAFAQFGEVSEAKVILDRETGRSRGFGFVTFNDGESAQSAVEQMNGTELDGRAIRVNEAEDRRRPTRRTASGATRTRTSTSGASRVGTTARLTDVTTTTTTGEMLSRRGTTHTSGGLIRTP